MIRRLVLRTSSLGRWSSTSVSRLRIMESTSTSPFFNLATEEWIFREMEPNSHLLFLWRNEKTVVIGKHQNAFAECNLRVMEADGVHLARRRSGGGAVYQDLGNTCFTFLSPRESYDKDRNTQIVVQGLRSFGLSAMASGRNDITVGGRKVSGSAFKLASDRAFHHGTLLIDVDLSVMGRYLTPNQEKLKSKGVKSVAARVANLRELNPGVTHESLTRALCESFLQAYGATQVEREVLREEDLQQMPEIQKYHAELLDWDWRFGRSPAFDHAIPVHRFEWGSFDVRYTVADGAVADVRVWSDALDMGLVESLQDALLGTPFREADLWAALEGSARDARISDAESAVARVKEFAEWLVPQMATAGETAAA